MSGKSGWLGSTLGPFPLPASRGGALGFQALQLCERGKELASAIQFLIYQAAWECYRRLPPWNRQVLFETCSCRASQGSLHGTKLS